MLTRAHLEKRLQGLHGALREAQATLVKAKRDLDLYDGAIQECEWALSYYEDEAVPIEDILPDGMDFVGIETNTITQ